MLRSIAEEIADADYRGVEKKLEIPRSLLDYVARQAASRDLLVAVKDRYGDQLVVRIIPFESLVRVNDKIEEYSRIFYSPEVMSRLHQLSRIERLVRIKWVAELSSLLNNLFGVKMVYFTIEYGRIYLLLKSSVIHVCVRDMAYPVYGRKCVRTLPYFLPLQGIVFDIIYEKLF